MNFSHSPSIFQVGSVKAKVAFWEAMNRQEPELPAPHRPRAAALPVAAVAAPAPAGKPDPIPNEQPSAAPLDMEVATETLEVTAVAALLELADHKHWTMKKASLDNATPPAPLDVELAKPAAVLDDQKMTLPESKPEVAVDASTILPHDLEAFNDLSRTDVIQADQPSDYDLQRFKIPIDAIQQKQQQCLRLDPTPLSPQQHEEPAHRECAPEDDVGDAQKPRNHLPQVKPLASTAGLHQQPKQSDVPLTPQPPQPQTLPSSEPPKMKINQQAQGSTKGCGWSWAIKEARRVLPNPLRGKRNRRLRQNHHQVESALPRNVAAALGVLQQTDVLQTEGILRLSGRKIRINQLLAMDARKRTIKWSKEDVHDITGFILSKYRKAFEEGIIPESVWIAARKNPEDLDLDPAEVWSQLDHRSRTWLKEILQLGRAVVSQQDQNRMSASNVAMVLSPLALTWCFEPIRHMERLQPARELFLDWLDMVPWAA